MLPIASAFFVIVHILQLTAGLLIDENLLKTAEEEGHVDTFIQFTPLDFGTRTMQRISLLLEKKSAQNAFAGLQEFSTLDTPRREQPGRGQRRRIVMELLQKHAAKTQALTLQELRGLGYDVHSFWINNSILIKKAPLNVLTLIIAFATREESHNNICAIFPNRIVAQIPPVREVPVDEHLSLNDAGRGAASPNQEEASLPWNIRLINADKVWKMTRGEGVVVANIDTGVDFLHPLLLHQYRGFNHTTGKVGHEYHWFDPEGKAPLPVDFHGHGTHTMGTMVGREVGIAMGAKWIAAQGCDARGCSQERLLASAQWVMCPMDDDGENPRCDLGADIVNNSWGGEITDEESMTWFSSAVDAWLAAGLWPIFAQGNSGPECGTAGTPGDLEKVIGVGAVDENGVLTEFSSRGPGGSRLGHSRSKPDYVAPGKLIVSCKPGGEIVPMSGTSMAAPHVSAVAALILSLMRNLSFAQFRTILTQTANTVSLKEPRLGQLSCYGKRWDAFPNYHYGFGLIDAHAAVLHLLKGDSIEAS